MSELCLLMFNLRCLVFPFHRLKAPAGPASSPLPSLFPVKGGVAPCAAYLRRYYGISCPFWFDCGDEWAATVPLWTPHLSSDDPWSSERNGSSLQSFTCFVPHTECYSTFLKPSPQFHLSLLCPQVRVFKKQKVERTRLFCWEKEIKSQHCTIIVSWSKLFKRKSSFIDFGKLKMFRHQSTVHHCSVVEPFCP